MRSIIGIHLFKNNSRTKQYNMLYHLMLLMLCNLILFYNTAVFLLKASCSNIVSNIDSLIVRTDHTILHNNIPNFNWSTYCIRKTGCNTIFSKFNLIHICYNDQIYIVQKVTITTNRRWLRLNAWMLEAWISIFFYLIKINKHLPLIVIRTWFMMTVVKFGKQCILDNLFKAVNSQKCA